MFRVTVAPSARGTEVVLEGRLVGAWVEELDRCWRESVGRAAPRPVRLHLDALTYVDEAGRDLLAILHAQGAELIATEVAPRALADEIRAARAAS